MSCKISWFCYKYFGFHKVLKLTLIFLQNLDLHMGFLKDTTSCICHFYANWAKNLGLVLNERYFHVDCESQVFLMLEMIVFYNWHSLSNILNLNLQICSNSVIIQHVINFASFQFFAVDVKHPVSGSQTIWSRVTIFYTKD